MIRRNLSRLATRCRQLFSPWTASRRTQAELDALYRFLYFAFHDVDKASDLAAFQTRDAFGIQWERLSDGQLMLSDPWFRKNVTRILCEQELMLPADWFAGKDVLDCGCGGGRWSYGFAKLGANVTAVDVNTSAIEVTRQALEPFDVRKAFVQSPLESLSESLPADRTFDVVFSWGVLHHCRSFSGALKEISRYVKEGGLLYLFLYGREEVSFDEELQIFKQRVYYNSLPDWEEREKFLLRAAGGDRAKMNKKHDKLAPLVNRRLEFPFVRDLLSSLEFSTVELTKEQSPSWSEAQETGRTRNLFIRAVRGDARELQKTFLPSPEPPYWFWKYRRPELAFRFEQSEDDGVSNSRQVVNGSAL